MAGEMDVVVTEEKDSVGNRYEDIRGRGEKHN